MAIKIFILGIPGTGKSTFVKALITEAQGFWPIESLAHLWEENVPFTLVPITDSPNSMENQQFKVSALNHA